MTKNTADTRSIILEVALQLFLEKGYKDVSYRELMKKTGLSKGAIYHHFESKEDILFSVFEFFLKATQQPVVEKPEDQVKDYESFRKLFIGIKKEQFKNFKKTKGAELFKPNKLLFFLEAMNENAKIKKIIEELLKHEMKFLENCFLGLKKYNKLPKGKDPVLLAKGLFWALQGAEMIMFFVEQHEQEKDYIKIYNKTIEDFFKII